MTPGQARIALLSFFVVTTGVAVNALFLQARTAAPARTAVERPTPAANKGRKRGEAARADRSSQTWPGGTATQMPLRIARFAPDSARLDSLPDDPQDTATVAAIQRELAARGYGPLASDGVTGLGTRSAIIAFEHDHGLSLTGEASEDLLKRILLDAPAGPGAQAVPRAKASDAEQVIRSVQRGLATLGYQISRIDGRLGEDTVKAIRDFEVDKGQVPKGRISPELVAQISEAAAQRPAAR